MLKGTKIRRESGKHEYIFDENPPYEIIHNKYISSDELNQIHLVETFLDIYWNKGFMCETIKLLLKNNNLAYEFLYDLGLYYQKLKFSQKRYQLIDIYKNIKEYLEYNKIYNMEIDAQLKLDYLNYNKIKPKPFWNEKLNKNDIIRSFFKCDSSFNIDILYKYSLVTKFKSGYLIALFLPNIKEFYVFENNQIKRIG